MLIAGRLVDRSSPRPILLLSALLGGIGVALSGGIHSISELRIFLFFAGLGSGANWPVPTATIQRWFYRRPRAGLALSIAVTGLGMGALVFAPFINYLILNYGWRKAYPVVGLIFFLATTLAAFIIKRSPVETKDTSESPGSELKLVSIREWTTREVIVTPAFLGMTYVFCIGDLSFAVVSVHLVPHALDVGISPTVAAAALGLLGGFTIPGRLTGGLLSEKISWEKVLAVSAFGMAISMLLLIFLKSNGILYSFVLLYGAFAGFRVPVQVGILASYFGTRSLGTLIGISAAIMVFGAALAPYVAGFIFDTTGSYFWAFVIIMVALASAGVVANIMKKPIVR